MTTRRTTESQNSCRFYSGESLTLKTGPPVRLVVKPDLYLRLSIDPAEKSSLDDRFVLSSTDGDYHREKRVTDDTRAGDSFVDLRFRGLLEDKSYTLQVFEFAGSQPYNVFESVPYAELVDLEADPPEPDPDPWDRDDTDAQGTLKVRLQIDPADAASLDDRFVLRATDGSFYAEKTVADDLLPGDGSVDLEFTGLPEGRRYTLEVHESASLAPYTVFEDLPYAEIASSPPKADQDEGAVWD